MSSRIELIDKNILVVGLGQSGQSAANFLIQQGALVTITDVQPASRLTHRLAGLRKPARLVLGGHKSTDFLSADLIILSPGVSTSLPQLQQAQKQAVPIFSEVELAYRFLKGKVIGITGSNGKTTTTALIGELFKRSRKKHLLAGNIGLPLTQFLGDTHSGTDTTFVVELSSFQLETIDEFKSDIALLLNVSPDHLDRYRRFEDYFRAKQRIFLNQSETDFAVINADHRHCRTVARNLNAQVFPFSRQALPEGAFIEGDKIQIQWKGPRFTLMPADQVSLKGKHNLENVLAAAAAGFLSDIDPALMAQTFSTFAGIEHRLEFVRCLGGVDFYNDSKATNVESTRRALESFEQPLVMIMGGQDKGGDFASLRSLVAKKVKFLILTGEASKEILQTLSPTVPTQSTRDLDGAVQLAHEHACPGDTVLLAPACASFDMFKNFEHRGQVFKDLVAKLEVKRPTRRKRLGFTPRGMR